MICTNLPEAMDLATIIVLLAAALLQLDYVTAIPLHDFYPYGAVNGDQALPKSNDGSSPAIQLEVPFRLFSRERSTIYVSSELHIVNRCMLNRRSTRSAAAVACIDGANCLKRTEQCFRALLELSPNYLPLPCSPSLAPRPLYKLIFFSCRSITMECYLLTHP